MNKKKYYITGHDSLIATVYEHDEYGRTMVLYNSPEIDETLTVRDAEYPNEKLKDISILDFLLSML